jgi:hypothetical protein
MSSDLITLMQLRYIIIGGSCARANYRANVNAVQRHTLLMSLGPNVELECDLDFIGHSLERIIIYVEHPSAVYFANTTQSFTQSLKFDAGSNFILWLLGRPDNESAIQTLVSQRGSLYPRSAPISEMRRYMSVETSMSKILEQEEYSISFLEWARKFLADEFTVTIQRQESIAKTCAAEMERRAEQGEIKNFMRNVTASATINDLLAMFGSFRKDNKSRLGRRVSP